ncbi:PIN domain-containing protein [Sphingomonas sp. PP-CC-3A-396]|uniref:PIN domain-containing protein n=1 Tax=Sphingomonas sp. PP-CC-3A-396 TaxID=2135655 RepID=UPI00104CD22B|nr:PIN domain-containing protein [Sphingomonas sp. PP-CC-3A-396]TCQ06412.1 putative nucleic acid-binding protein [Sphingomonas sp. PP-CC-3A-396]
MKGYLFETNTLSALLSTDHTHHAAAVAIVQSLPDDALKFVSCVALAELQFGRELIVAFTGKDPTQLTQTLTRASAGAVLDVTRHTASNYAELKANLAKTYLAKWMRRDRPRWVENWIDKATGQHLQIDENDLWICAQAREHDLILVTADQGIRRIAQTDPAVQLLLI